MAETELEAAVRTKGKGVDMDRIRRMWGLEEKAAKQEVWRKRIFRSPEETELIFKCSGTFGRD